MIARGTADNIIRSRQLVLQSKMLLLKSAERQAADADTLEVLQTEVDRTHRAYRAAVLTYGTPDTEGYWVVAYSRLIETASALVGRLHQAELPPGERAAAEGDVETLQYLIDRWTDAMRASMSVAVA